MNDSCADAGTGAPPARSERICGQSKRHCDIVRACNLPRAQAPFERAGRGADTFGEPVDLVRAVTRGLARATAGGRACRRAPGTGAPSCARACTGPAPTLHCIRRTALPGSQTPRSPTTGRRMSTALRIRRHKRLHPQALLPADGRARHTEGNLEGARLEPSERITQLQNTTPPSPGLLRRTFVLIGPSMYSRCDPV